MEEMLKDPIKPSGPIESNGWTVEVDRELCIGAGTCVVIAPKSFALDDEAKAIIVQGIDEDDKDTILAAAKSCPVEAIIIKDKDGNRIYPQ